jgi:hypothetical protein
MANKPKRKITSAYEAWHWLYSHPKLMLRARNPEPKDHANALKKQGFIITRDKNGQYWREWRHSVHHAVVDSLSIFYAKVDADGEVNDDASLNVNEECWLELGPMEWGYATPWDEETSLMKYHAVELDCGGKTFDEALVEMANLVLKEYGNYRKKGKYPQEGACGKPKCADCGSVKRMVRNIKRKMKKNRHESH